MKIIRWLLSHIFLILLIVVVIYGYMFWGNLAGKDTPAGKAIAYLSSEFVEVENFVNAVKSKQAELGGDRSPAEKDVEAAVIADSAIPAAAPVAAPAAATDRQTIPAKNPPAAASTAMEHRPIEPPPVSLSYSQNQVRVRQNSAGLIQSEAKPQNRAMAEAARSVAPAMATNATQEKFVSAEVEKQLNNVDEQGKVIDPSQPSDKVRETWVTARTSFYQRDYEKSVQSYHKVIDSTEDNFDAYGELGNVYFNQGKKQQAASAYFEAAAILVRKGQVNRARSLMGLLRHLDKSKADELQKLINSVHS